MWGPQSRWRRHPTGPAVCAAVPHHCRHLCPQERARNRALCALACCCSTTASTQASVRDPGEGPCCGRFVEILVAGGGMRCCKHERHRILWTGIRGQGVWLPGCAFPVLSERIARRLISTADGRHGGGVTMSYKRWVMAISDGNGGAQVDRHHGKMRLGAISACRPRPSRMAGKVAFHGRHRSK